MRGSGLIRLDTLLAVQAELGQNRAGLRKLPGTVLKNEATGAVIYEPPQDAAEVESLMGNLIDFIHADDGLDPLLRMAITHQHHLYVAAALEAGCTVFASSDERQRQAAALAGLKVIPPH